MATLRLYCGVFFLFWLNPMIAQNPQPFFRNYTTDQGLPSSETYQTIQDSKGYIWISTDNGVSRFDGYEFRNFSAKDGLMENVIFHLQEGIDGRIWMHGMSGNLFYFENDTIRPYQWNNLIQEYCGKMTSYDFYIDKNNSVYHTARNQGVFKIDVNGVLEFFSPKNETAFYIRQIEERCLYFPFYSEIEDTIISLPIEIHSEEEIIIDNYFLAGIPNVKNRCAQQVGTNQYLVFDRGTLILIKNGKKEWTTSYPYLFDKYSIFRNEKGNIFIGSINGLGVRVYNSCLLYTSPSPRDQRGSRMPSSA